MFKNAAHLHRVAALGGGSLLALALSATATPALASRGDGDAVRKAGVCSGNSTSKIKVKPEDAGLEVEFEVDSNVNGQVWHVTLKRNGTRFFSGNRTTHAPSGSFEVSRTTGNAAGADTLKGRAVNQATGEVCHATVSI